MPAPSGWTIEDWQNAYQSGAKPDDLLGELVANLDTTDNAWIALSDSTQLQTALAKLAETLEKAGGDISQLPLYGVPLPPRTTLMPSASPPQPAARPMPIHPQTMPRSLPG
jgi:allophanate hydrolase